MNKVISILSLGLILNIGVGMAADFSLDGYDYTIVSPAECTVSIEKCYLDSVTITIPETITFRNKTFTVVSIGDRAFINNTASMIDMPNSITSIGEYSFLGAKAQVIRLSENIKEIGKGAFCESDIVQMVIPDSYAVGYRTTLKDTFLKCKNLRRVMLGKNVAGEQGPYLISMSRTFKGCDNLEEIIIQSPVVPYWEERYVNSNETNEPFDRMTYTFATLKVPGEALVNYRTNHLWKKFGTITSIDGATAYDATLYKISALAKEVTWRETPEYYVQVIDDASEKQLVFLYYICDLPDGTKAIGGGIFTYAETVTTYDVCEFVGIIDDFTEFKVPTKNGGTLSFSGILGSADITVSEPNQNFSYKFRDAMRQY